MRILVTGATGRVGSRFVPRLIQWGDQVRVLVRQPDQVESLKARGAEVLAGDLARPETLPAAVDGVDAVVHLAAFFRGATEAQAQATNLNGTLALAQAALRAGVPRFVFPSTQLVYGPGQDRLHLEDEELHPADAYPISKAGAEAELVKLNATAPLGLRILRLPFVYGEGDPHLPDTLLRLGDWHPAARLQMVHHADVGQALALVTRLSGIDGRVYNVADDAPLTVAEILRLHGRPEPALTNPRTPNVSWNIFGDSLRIRDELGFRPIYPSLYAARAAGAL